MGILDQYRLDGQVAVVTGGGRGIGEGIAHALSEAGASVVLAARRRPYHNIADFTRLGLDPTKVRLLVVKSGYLSPELAPIANPNLMALTDGVINQDIENLPSHRRHQPSYPFVKDFSYTANVFFSTTWVSTSSLQH